MVSAYDIGGSTVPAASQRLTVRGQAPVSRDKRLMFGSTAFGMAPLQSLPLGKSTMMLHRGCIRVTPGTLKPNKGHPMSYKSMRDSQRAPLSTLTIRLTPALIAAIEEIAAEDTTSTEDSASIILCGFLLKIQHHSREAMELRTLEFVRQLNEEKLDPLREECTECYGKGSTLHSSLPCPRQDGQGGRVWCENCSSAAGTYLLTRGGKRPVP